MTKTRKHLSFTGLTKSLRESFSKIEVKERKVNPSGVASSPNNKIPLSDFLMAGYAIFSLKYESLLRFDNDSRGGDPNLMENLKSVFGIAHPPSDTRLRERLDDVDPRNLDVAFKDLFAQVQRGKGLEGMESYRGDYLVSLDGTGVFASSKIRCENCMIKNEGKESESYYHQDFCAVLVKPGCKTVLPLGSEAIVKSDGMKKNDCEFNAAKRLIPRLRTQHPHLAMCLVLDGLHSKAPILKLCDENNFRYIIVAKDKDHKHLLSQFNDSSLCAVQSYTEMDEKISKEYRFVDGLELNESNPEIKVNVLEYTETKEDKIFRRFVWITNYPLIKNNVAKITDMGRARWKVENETFNTLKNLGYNYEHNFGHGNKNLSVVFSVLMLLAFAVDQALERCCHVFKAAREKAATKQNLWRKIRSLLEYVIVASMEEIYQIIIGNTRLKPIDTG